MFEQSVAPPGRTLRAWTVMVSILLQVQGIGLAVVAPLVFWERLPPARLATEVVRVPPPPGRPMKYVKIVDVVRQRAARPAALVQPSVIPSQVAMVIDPAPAAPLAPSGPWVAGGTGEPGGVQRGILNSVLNDIFQRLPQPAPAPPVRRTEPAPEPRRVERLRVGGDVQEARLLRRVMPVYPVLARQARIQGAVRLEAVIARDGTIQQLHVVSGHPLLRLAAVEAVKQWVYQPTLLNHDPVEVLTVIDVHFTLSH